MLHHIFPAKGQAESCFLPFARLAASTFLPPFVLMRERKPWTFACCLSLGWNVIFMRSTSSLYEIIRRSADSPSVSCSLKNRDTDRILNFIYYSQRQYARQAQNLPYLQKNVLYFSTISGKPCGKPVFIHAWGPQIPHICVLFMGKQFSTTEDGSGRITGYFNIELRGLLR